MLKKHLNYLILLGLKRSVLALVSLRLQSLFWLANSYKHFSQHRILRLRSALSCFIFQLPSLLPWI